MQQDCVLFLDETPATIAAIVLQDQGSCDVQSDMIEQAQCEPRVCA
jgi:hypothetical protein